MFPKIFLILVSCAIVVISAGDIKRVKRAKYYSYPSRFYRRPPPPHFVKGAFSYTPPPFATEDSHRPKVSKQTIDGLGDDDINNLVKYLSKKDLDKIIEFAGEKQRYADKYVDGDENFGFGKNYKRPERTVYKIEDTEQRFSLNGPYVKDQEEKFKVVYNDPNYTPSKPKTMYAAPTFPNEYTDRNPNGNFITQATQPKIIYTNPPLNPASNTAYVNHPNQFPKAQNPSETYLNSEVPIDTRVNVNMPNGQRPFISNNVYSPEALESESQRHFLYVTPSSVNPSTIFTDSNTMKEEQLPKPTNLREDYYEESETNNVPKVVKSESYKVESLRDVPLMNYHNSKLHSVSSYNVPHYTITSSKSQQTSKSPQSSLTSNPDPSLKIEHAPPGYTGKEQSDAHLKAVKIWTHQSKGTAYTLHDDGTLSLEKSGRPRY